MCIIVLSLTKAPLGLSNRFNITFSGFSWLELAGSWDLIRIRLNIETYSPLKPTMVDFIFIGSNSSGLIGGSYRSRDTSCRLSLKPGSIGIKTRAKAFKLCCRYNFCIISFVYICNVHIWFLFSFDHQVVAIMFSRIFLLHNILFVKGF